MLSNEMNNKVVLSTKEVKIKKGNVTFNISGSLIDNMHQSLDLIVNIINNAKRELGE